MGSSSSKENEGGHPSDFDENELVRQHINRINTAGASTPTGGYYPNDARQPNIDMTDAQMPYNPQQLQLAPAPAQIGSSDEMEVDIRPSLAIDSDAIVPMVFKWEHGGRNVYITGTFNGWNKRVPMHRSGNDFTYIINLSRGKHAYKFIVDDEWRFAPDQPTVSDLEGNVNNYVDVSEFIPLREFELDRGTECHLRPSSPTSETMYGRFMPDIDDYTKEPPPLPPHLRHIILNKVPPSVDSRLLPVPQHVALNHLYCTAIKDGMMVLGVTQRYKQKFVTTVYYSLMPGTG